MVLVANNQVKIKDRSDITEDQIILSIDESLFLRSEIVWAEEA
jgi:hypothetical protein